MWGEYFELILGDTLLRLVRTAVYWLPLLLGYVAVHLWLFWIRARFLASIKFSLLEIKLPRDVAKTPAAMEIALSTAFTQTWDGDNLLIGQWWLGQARAWFSLEIVSIGGQIHLYIWTQKFYQNLVESQLYSQYPGIEINEVEDYVFKIPADAPDTKSWDIYGLEYGLAREDAYPLKTYVQYGLDKPQLQFDPTAEPTIPDPMTAMFEYLANLKPNEQLWIQILVMSTKKRFRKKGSWFAMQDWKGDSKSLIEKLRGWDPATKKYTKELTSSEKEVVEEIERGLNKPGFDVGIRVLSLAEGGSVRAIMKATLGGLFKQYAAPDFNNIKAVRRTSVVYPWMDLSGKKVKHLVKEFFDGYRRRGWFYPPHDHKPFVLNSEELATIFHLPGRVAATPTLQRIDSKRSVPPSSLPV